MDREDKEKRTDRVSLLLSIFIFITLVVFCYYLYRTLNNQNQLMMSIGRLLEQESKAIRMSVSASTQLLSKLE